MKLAEHEAGSTRRRTSTAAPRPADHGPVDHGVMVDHLPVPDALRPFVTTLFHFSSRRALLTDWFPAIAGLLSLTMRGSSATTLAGQSTADAPLAALLTPTSAAMGIEARGPFDAIGAVFSPLGWAALVGLHAQDHGDRLYDAADHFAGLAELTHRLRAAFAAGTGPGELAGELADFLLARVRRVNPRHAEVLQHVAQWMGSALDPQLPDLFARCAYSERQVERLVQRYFGCPPKLLVRKYRALRVMALLLSPDTTPEQAAALADLYYDQSHMIRDLRQFAGRTPTQMADQATPVLAALVDIRNYRQIDPRVAPLPAG